MPDPEKSSESPHDRRSFFRHGLSHLLQPAASYIASKLPDIAANLEGIAPSGSRPLRPPGALPEPDFLNTCYRCGSCADHCPADSITLLRVENKQLDGTPTIDPTRRACVVCDDLTCMKVCPSGALKLIDRTAFRIGLAVWDETTCLRPSVPNRETRDESGAGPRDGQRRSNEGRQGGESKRGDSILRMLADLSAKLRAPVDLESTATEGRAATVRERMAPDVEGQPPTRDDAGAAANQRQPTETSSEHCRICVDVCPYGTDAIRIEAGRIHVIDPRDSGVGCTGCGLCQEQCPTRPQRAIRVLPYSHS